MLMAYAPANGIQGISPQRLTNIIAFVFHSHTIPLQFGYHISKSCKVIMSKDADLKNPCQHVWMLRSLLRVAWLRIRYLSAS